MFGWPNIALDFVAQPEIFIPQCHRCAGPRAWQVEASKLLKKEKLQLRLAQWQRARALPSDNRPKKREEAAQRSSQERKDRQCRQRKTEKKKHGNKKQRRKFILLRGNTLKSASISRGSSGQPLSSLANRHVYVYMYGI